MFIPLFSPTIRRSEMDAVLTCLVDEKVGPGEMSDRLEKKVCEFFQASCAVALRSPRIALRTALLLLQLPENATVAISALAPTWQYVTIVQLGYKPLVLDVDRQTALISQEELERLESEKANALVLTGTLGNAYLPEVFEKISVPIIEDISQSVGSEFLPKLETAQAENDGESNTIEAEGQKVGTFALFTILGFEEKDMLTGGGGAVLFVQDKRSAAPLKKASAELLYTDKLPDINAALSFVQLKNLKKNRTLRQEMEVAFRRAIISTKHKPLMFSENLASSVYNFPVILERGFKEVEKYCQKKQIEIGMAFENSVIAFLGDDYPGLDNARLLCMKTVLFPLYPRLGAKKADLVSKVLSTLP